MTRRQGRTLPEHDKGCCYLPWGTLTALALSPLSSLSRSFIRRVFHDLSFWNRLSPSLPIPSLFFSLALVTTWQVLLSFCLLTLKCKWYERRTLPHWYPGTSPASEQCYTCERLVSTCWMLDKCICLSWLSPALILVAPKVREMLYSNEHKTGMCESVCVRSY